MVRSKRAACTEENELLNATSIKMTDAPFGRSDSEDDIVEDYDDSVSFKASCFRNRTPLERLLALIVVIFLVVIVGLAIGLTRPQIVPVTKYCKSPPCVQAASSVLSGVDWSVDPCTDFFRFACGQWLRSNPIPRGFHHWDRLQELSGQNLYVLNNLIESNRVGGSSMTKMRSFYNSCLGSAPLKKSRVLKQFASLIEDVGGWSYSPNDTLENWVFQVELESLHRYGAWPFFKIKVEVDERDPTRAHILKVDTGETVLPPELFLPDDDRASPSPSPSVSPSPPEPSKQDENGTKSSPLPVTDPHVHPARNASELKRVFLDETVHLLTAFGATQADAQAKAESMLKLEEIVAAASQRKNHIHDRFSLYNVITAGEMEANFSMITWVQYFNSMGFNVNAETEVVVLHPDYMSSITTLLRSFLKGSEENKRTLRDYLAVSLIRSFKPYFDGSLFELEESEEDEIQEQWKRCTFYTNKALGFATGAIFVKGTNSEGSVEKVEKLITYVKNAFKDYLLNKFWMDKLTKKKAAEKIDHIIDKISYPSFILNKTFLDTYYQNFQVFKDDWFSNILSWRMFELGNMNFDLPSVPDRKARWLRPPVTENAYYSPMRNDVIFPIAMFHLPFYIPDGPSAVNFGAMGSIIGHEITHAFDFQGRQYDGQGKLTDWWDHQTADNFRITTGCMRDQYSRIKVKGLRVDGDFTLDENIADNGGLRAAIYAYETWINKFGKELQLPGVNMTLYQVFYTSYAQMYCSKWTDLGLMLHLLTDPHSPGYARVNGVLSNSQTFSWAFQCPLDTKMNPRIKCEVW